MKEYVLISDSTADLPMDIIKDLDVEIIPFSYSINDEIYEFCLNYDDEAISDFYNKLRKGAMPVTSQINPVMYKEYFEKYVKDGKSVIYLSFSSGLSGSFNTSLVGLDMLMDEYPDADVTIIDSLSASIGQGVFLYVAAQKRLEGIGKDDLVKWIEATKNHVGHWFMVEDLFHLKRGGRVTAVEALVGSALKIKPILGVDEEGKLVVKSKTRGVGKALEYLIERAMEEAADVNNTLFLVGHADSVEKAEKLSKMLIDNGVPENNIMMAPIGPIIGTHVGPGMAALAFVTKK